MNHPKEPINRLFDRFNSCFAQLAKQLGFVFELRAGPNLGRTLRLNDDPLKRGVFLELKHHWSKSDSCDPVVTLGYGAWHRPQANNFPLYVFTKKLFEGHLSTLEINKVAELLTAAAIEVKAVTKEKVMNDGRMFTEWPKNASEAGSYYE
jgi:hypothetical protein